MATICTTPKFVSLQGKVKADKNVKVRSTINSDKIHSQCEVVGPYAILYFQNIIFMNNLWYWNDDDDTQL